MGAGEAARSEGPRNPESELISRLRQLPAEPQPDPRFKSELRTQLVAIAPRIVAEGVTEAKKSEHRHRNPSRGLAALRRPLLAIGGAGAVLVLLLGLAVHMSGGALPGQSLYGLKRASEDFRLSVNGGSDADRGRRYLQLASNRAGESAKLVASEPTGADTDSLVASTLRSADSETRTGMQLLGGAAVSARSAGPIAPVRDWATGQASSIRALIGRLSAGPARDQAGRSLSLVQQVSARVSAWYADLDKGCLSEARSDDLGPKGC